MSQGAGNRSWRLDLVALCNIDTRAVQCNARLNCQLVLILTGQIISINSVKGSGLSVVRYSYEHIFEKQIRFYV